MIGDFETALQQLLKTVITEAAIEVLREHRVMDRPQPSISSSALSDDCSLLRPSEVAKRLAISERHLNKLTRTGVVPCVRVGQCVRYSTETIRQWIRESESAEQVQAQSIATKRTPALTAIESRVTQKLTPKLTAPRGRTTTTAEPAQKQRKKAESIISVRPKESQSEDRPNPFSAFLKELGVERTSLGPLTNGELRRIAEVDIATFHGWMYRNRELPEAALNKLRQHFLPSVNDEQLTGDSE